MIHAPRGFAFWSIFPSVLGRQKPSTFGHHEVVATRVDEVVLLKIQKIMHVIGCIV